MCRRQSPLMRGATHPALSLAYLVHVPHLFEESPRQRARWTRPTLERYSTTSKTVLFGVVLLRATRVSTTGRMDLNQSSCARILIYCSSKSTITIIGRRTAVVGLILPFHVCVSFCSVGWLNEPSLFS